MASVEGGAPPAFVGPRVWEVAALVHAMADLLAARFGAVAVRGEVSGFARAASGHCYFTLKDGGDGASLRCAMFRRAAALLDFAPQEGDLVELRGRAAVYEPRGELQFVAESMRRSGAGALHERFLRLKAALAAEGLFDPARKRALPGVPRGLAVVTSLGAAALRDVVIALRRRAPHVRVIVIPSLVQGPDAPSALADAIGRAGARADAEALIVCRGGGSAEDLWAFNEAVVVRAIAACPIPVIAGIGHETDVSLADFAADLRAPTPTAAAELAAVPRDELLQALARAAERSRRSVAVRLDAHGQRLDRLAMRLTRPAQHVARHRERLALLAARCPGAAARAIQREAARHEAIEQRMRQSVQRALEARRQRLELLAARLETLDPSRVLARGYAWLSDAGGAMLCSAASIGVGDALWAQLADGRIGARVTAVDLPLATKAPVRKGGRRAPKRG